MKNPFSFKALFVLLTLLSSVLVRSQNYSLIMSTSMDDLENPYLAKDPSGIVYIYGGLSITYGMSPYLYKFNPTTYQWTSLTYSLQSATPVYGTMGVGSTTNSPGARNLGASWTDLSGNFWIYGGTFDLINNLKASDLWKYTASTGEWTWMGGSSATNQAAAYGTMGVPSSTAHPGARQGIASWTDASGNFWLFGGASSTGLKNDLWKYDPITNQWTWVNGSSGVNSSGSYGTLGVSSSLNQPPARWTSGISDGTANFYIFGGLSSNYDYKNDLWKYDTGTNQWTWISGGNGTNSLGVYGTKGVASSANYPGGRSAHTTFWDTGGNIWVFGGWGYNLSTYDNERNDLWKYSVGNNTWTWVKGDDASMYAAGSYGPLYFALPSNEPFSTRFQAGWTDASNNLWIFAGSHYDLWKFNNCIPQTFTLTSSTTSMCPGNSATLSFSGASTFTWAGSSSTNTSIQVTPTITQTYYVGAKDAAGCPSGAAVTVSILPTPSLVVLSSHTAICTGQSAILTVNGAASYTWNTLQNTAAITISPTTTSSYTVLGTGSNGCSSASASIALTVYPLPTVAVTSSQSLVCVGQQAILSASGAALYIWSGNLTGPSIVVSPASNTVYQVIGSSANGCVNTGTVMQQVAQLPQITIAGSQSVSCSGQAITINASGASTYTWNTNQTGTSINVSPLLSTSYTVTGTNANGCVNTATLFQQINPLPVVTVASSQTLPCSGQQVNLTASGASSYTWNSSQTGPSINVSPVVSTNYTVTGTNTNGCTNTAVFSLNVLPLPPVTANSPNPTICEGESTILMAAGAQNYTWTPGNLTGVNLLVTPIANITYTVIGTDISGCSNTETLTVSVDKCTALSLIKKENEFRLSPNPNAGEFIISADASVKGSTLLILNALGQVVYFQVLQQEHEFIKTTLSKGIYYYSITQDGSNPVSGKVIIE